MKFNKWAWMLALPWAVYVKDFHNGHKTIGLTYNGVFTEHCFNVESCEDRAQALNDANEKRALRKMLDTKGPQYQETGIITRHIQTFGCVDDNCDDKKPTGGAR